MGPMTVVISEAISGGTSDVAAAAAADRADGEYRNCPAGESDTMSVASSTTELQTLVPG